VANILRFEMTALHTPVLLDEVLQIIAPQPGETIVDGTLGLAGHGAAFLEAIGQTGQLIGFDADSRNLRLARERIAGHENVRFENRNFREMGQVLAPDSVDVIFLDIGVSSLHFDEAERGFSLKKDGPLDMRLDQSGERTAAEILNFWAEEELADIFHRYGELRSARRLATEILAARKVAKFQTTLRFADFVRETLGSGDSVVAQVFQALRIAVNDELGALEEALVSSLKLLKPGGRVGVISFHSLEDRIVKEFFRTESRDCICPPSEPICCCGHERSLKILTKKPVVPEGDEIQKNPRARSAKLRVAQKI